MIGIDEVGRGCWAGPLLVVAAREKAELPTGLDDSKVLSKTKREAIFRLFEQSCDFGEGWVSAKEINKLGLTEAMKLGVKRALNDIKAEPREKIIMDGSINYCEAFFINVKCEPRADAKYPIVSAASIYAKVLRDNKMTELAQDYPSYGFEKHVGYGTKQHIDALEKFGVSKIHRLSYKPVKRILERDNNKYRQKS